jgi:hypothetical protein
MAPAGWLAAAQRPAAVGGPTGRGLERTQVSAACTLCCVITHVMLGCLYEAERQCMVIVGLGSAAAGCARASVNACNVALRSFVLPSWF